MMNEERWAQQGWQCPICKRVYSPTTIMCLYCGNGQVQTIATTDVQINVPSNKVGTIVTEGKKDKIPIREYEEELTNDQIREFLAKVSDDELFASEHEKY